MKLSAVAQFYSWGRASTAFNQIFIKRIMTFSKKALILAVIFGLKLALHVPLGHRCDVIDDYIARSRDRRGFNSLEDELVLVS